MAVAAIKTPFGADVVKTFAVYGVEYNPDTDCALFVIRDKTEKVVYWTSLIPVYDETYQAWMFNLHITHSEAERIPKGSYKYGITYYKDATFKTEEASEDEVDPGFMPSFKRLPVDGTVVVPIARKAYTVTEAVAREEGIE